MGRWFGAAKCAPVVVTAAIAAAALGHDAARAQDVRLAVASAPAQQPQLIAIVGAPNPRCSYYTGWKADGCKDATGAFLIAPYFEADNFYEFAAQSGQHWAKGPHPWTWNAPGVDYGVGPPLRGGGADPAKAVLPTGCVYLPTGSPAGGPEIHCGATANDPTFDGLDLSLGDCTPIVFAGRADSMLTISNSHIHNGANCAGPGGAVIRIIGATGGLSLVNDFIDEDYPRATAPIVLVGDGAPAAAPFAMIYSVVLNGAPTPMAGNFAGPMDIEESVFIGSAIASTDSRGERGELCELGCPAHPVIYPSVTYRNNVVVVPATTRLVMSERPPLTLAPAQTKSRFIKDHNIFVINFARGAYSLLASNLEGTITDNNMRIRPGYTGAIVPGATIRGLPGNPDAVVLAVNLDGDVTLSGLGVNGFFTGASAWRETTLAAMVRLSYSSIYGSAVVTNNFVDTTGAYSCVQDFGSLSGPSVVQGNRSLVTDQAMSGIGDKSTAGACAAVY